MTLLLQYKFNKDDNIHKQRSTKNRRWEYVQVDLKGFLLKSRIDLLDKINMKPCFILYDDDGQSKLN